VSIHAAFWLAVLANIVGAALYDWAMRRRAAK
jgi:hypothetical protein